ncbi:MAG: sulfatase-like hydrolase/transferase, partial [Verrucomicrobiota bacterium]
MIRVAILLLCILCSSTFAKASAERPNVILIMVDDMGFSDLGYHGGEIETPNLDTLAHGGVRFSQFYNSGRCCPTRATLMTGLHPHEVGIGHMTAAPGKHYKNRPPAYQGFLNHNCVTLGEVLKPAGYAPLMTGKWHLGFGEQDHWPLQRGFDKFYGCLPGATRFFHPIHPRGMTFGNEIIEDPHSTTNEAFYTTDAFTDYGIRFIREHLKEQADVSRFPSKANPFFLYLAYTAPHWPLQAFEDDIAKYRGKYKMGWDELRKRRHQKQIELGLIDPKWELSPKTPGIPDWSSLDEEKQDEMDLKMAVYAAMIDRIDQNIGKLVTFLKKRNAFENTLIMFLSDNGACQEGSMLGRGNFHDIEKRNQETANSYGEAWANAGSTPFRLYKHFAHEGGSATPFFMHWPARIQPQADWYDEPAQLIDLMPTILDVADGTYPIQAHGNDLPALDGISLRPAFDGMPLERSQPIFIEHENNAFVRYGDWKLVGRDVATSDGTKESKWELYNMVEDRTETTNLAADMRDRVKPLAAAWEIWAARTGVYPKPGTPKTKTTAKKENKSAEPKPVKNPPPVNGRPFTVSTTVRHNKPNGVVLGHGGLRFGWSLHFIDGKPAFSYRNEGKLTTLVSKNPVKGSVTVKATLDEKELSIAVDNKVVARTDSPGLMVEQPGLGMFVGLDGIDPVGKYKVPNGFNGTILDYKIDTAQPKVTMRTEWGEKVTAKKVWQEYPRPQLRRENWTNLNGHWDYAITSISQNSVPKQWDGKILVPFAVEAPLSGAERRFTPEDALWYLRSIDIQKKDEKRYLLNFEAVDYACTVWVNGKEAGSNIGGNLPFSFDVTDALKDGTNRIRLRVTDATDSAYQLHGKQRLTPKGIWYTPVSGIWQTVWMEEVPETYVENLKISASNTGEVKIEVSLGGTSATKPSLAAEASLNGEPFGKSNVKNSSILYRIDDPKLWSPASPTLYTLEINVSGENGARDTIHSYFAFRELGKRKDADGHWRLTLNDKEIFHWGTLDQGWWPDGLLTPPSNEAMVSDIKFLKDAGFNTIRKHIKVEPRRYYYHCDKMGMMVWQDQVSSGVGNPRAIEEVSPPWTRLLPGAVDSIWPDQAHEQFVSEYKHMIDTLGNHPSIVQWVPFNEAWGQHRTMSVGQMAIDYDLSRAINIASGGNFFPIGDIVDAHKYPHPEFPFDQDGG